MYAEKLLNEAKELHDTILSNRRNLHQMPGTGFDLKETVAFVKKELLDMGYEPVECGKAGLVALAGGKKPGKVFLLRADMDALPMEEKSGVKFASQNGKMHACGHDMHTSMLLGAARLLKKHENEINGTVKLMFQPAEEIFEGAKDMVEAGLLENPTVDAALMIHVMAGVPFEAGTILIASTGVSATAADFFEIKIKGKGCHGSMPNTGVDPISAAAHIIIALQEINARELALSEKAVLTIGTINASGAPNIIPDSVVMSGSIRTYDEETRAFIKNRLKEIAEGTAKTFRADAEVVFGSGCPTLVNDKAMAESAEKYTKELLGKDRVFTANDLNSAGGSRISKTAGSEDFAYVSQKVPSIMLSLAAGAPENGYLYSQHNPMVKFDEGALSNGSAVYAYTAMRWLEENK